MFYVTRKYCCLWTKTSYISAHQEKCLQNCHSFQFCIKGHEKIELNKGVLHFIIKRNSAEELSDRQIKFEFLFILDFVLQKYINIKAEIFIKILHYTHLQFQEKLYLHYYFPGLDC